MLTLAVGHHEDRARDGGICEQLAARMKEKPRGAPELRSSRTWKRSTARPCLPTHWPRDAPAIRRADLPPWRGQADSLRTMKNLRSTRSLIASLAAAPIMMTAAWPAMAEAAMLPRRRATL